MTSLQMRVVRTVLRLTRKPRMATVERARKRIADPKGSAAPPTKLVARHDVSSRQVEGFDCYTVTPRGGLTTRAVVYLHGGSYISEIAPQHWSFISRLADAGVRVEVPIYGLAPQHSYRDAYPFLIAVYRDLLVEVDVSAVAIAGDSAGGGLALGLAQALTDAGLPQPGRLVLISPWLDLTLSNPELPALAPRDPWLNIDGTVEAGKSWAGGDDPTDPRLSPLNGPLAGLAPMQVYVGTRELCLPDVLALQQQARAAGTTFELTVCEGAVHVYPLTPTPEGRRATRAIVGELSRM